MNRRSGAAWPVARLRALSAAASAIALLGLAACATTGAPSALTAGADVQDGPGGEAGPIALRDQGFFWVGKRASTEQGENGPRTTLFGQMYVGYQLVAEPKHPYPLVLVHGGGGQATDYMGTPDGRDGWLDYFLAAGFDVYFVDRPAYGRSPNNVNYGPLGQPTASEQIANAFTIRSDQYPGTGEANDPYVIEHTASSSGGPTVSNEILQENLAELLDRIGPAIMVTHSAGGPSGWLALDARPELVKGILAIETAGNFTATEGPGALAPLLSWSPALAGGEAIATVELPPEGEGLTACTLQPEGSVHTLPAFEGKPILGVVAPNSTFTPGFHCLVATLNQLGADASLARIKEDWGLEGNGHFMNEELNNGEIAQHFVEWLSTIE